MNIYSQNEALTVYQGDCREVLPTLPAESVQCCVTSPPYWLLRSYLPDGHVLKSQEVGQEPALQEYIDSLVAVFREVRRVLRPDGTLWLNLGDCYAQNSKRGDRSGGKNTSSVDGGLPRQRRTSGLKDKDLAGLPWRVAFALQEDGWYLRSDIVWNKPNALPESVQDRPTRSHEYLFLLSKNPHYYYDAAAIAERAVGNDPGNLNHKYSDLRSRNTGLAAIGPVEYRNKRSVWTVATAACPDAHFATFPAKLIEPCIMAGCPAGGVVLDPFAGTGIVANVALRFSRKAVLVELNPEYLCMIDMRTNQTALPGLF